MKKTAIILALVLLISAGLVGCKKDKNGASDLVGTWTLTSAEMGGQAIDSAELAMYGMDEMSADFKSDNKVTVMSNGVSYDGTYEQKDNNVVISANGYDMSLVKDGNTLVLNQGGIKMVFTK